MNAKKTGIAQLDDDSIKTLFEDAFRARIEDYNSGLEIDSDNFECEVEREGQTDGLRIKVTIFGLAGTTTRLQFHDKKTGAVIKGGKTLSVTTPKVTAKFLFDGSAELNTNDYVVFYKLEK